MELKVFIVDILPSECCKRENMEERMIEIENLVSTYGGIVVVKHIQRRGAPDYNTYIGSGKLEEIMGEMKESGATVLIFGNILKPLQIYRVNEELRTIGAIAWDRIDLILKIFERHATTTESRLEIELAAIKHMGPRIYDMSMELGSQGRGGGQSKGKGETNTEIMKRHLKLREENIKKDLEKFQKVRAEHRKSRKRKGFSTVGIVGYTNAGKSSLLNALTHKGVLAEDKLFATLGTSVGKLYIPYTEISPKIKKKLGLGEYENKEILLSDTIGFIRDLPPSLIKSFASTLEDSIEAEVLLHVIDSSDTKIDEKMKVVLDILEAIEATKNVIYVFNKIDSISKKQLSILKKSYTHLHPVFISSHTGEGLQKLKEAILLK